MSKKVIAASPTAASVQRVLELEHTSFKEEMLQRLKIQEGLAQSGFRMLVLANGGAIIALFSLIGSNAKLTEGSPSAALWFAFGFFAVGLVFTITANICGYFMQLHFTNATSYQMWNTEQALLGQPPSHDFLPLMKAAGRWELAAVSCFGGGVVGFIAGSALCFLAFIH